MYTKYERTCWRSLQQHYPDVCSVAEVEDLFAMQTTDLHEIVQKQSEWPTMDYTLKTLATHLGFTWRDTHPSGSASTEWYDRYVRGDATAKARILEYNEDDCTAMRVLLDGMQNLAVRA
jgi:predicted RecB family nuclease